MRNGLVSWLVFSGLLISLFGCDDGPLGFGLQPFGLPPEDYEKVEATTQWLFDEAARGPNLADLKQLKSIYLKVVTDKAKGAELAGRKDPAGHHFLCKLLELPAVQETKEILLDLVNNKLDQPGDIVNKPCSFTLFPIDILIKNRFISADKPDDSDEMTKLLVDQSSASTIGAVKFKDDLNKLLNALKNKGDQSHLTKVFTNAAVALRVDLLSWSLANQTDAKVKPALKAAAIIDLAAVVDEAKKTYNIDTKKLRFLYEMAIDSDTKAAALAILPAAVGDKFVNFLAKNPADADTLAIWIDYLARFNAVGMIAQINLAGAGSSPIDLMLSDLWRPVVGDVLASRQKIIALMLNHGDQATVRTANDNDKLKTMLDAVLAKQPALLNTAFGHVDLTTREADLINWVSTKLADPQVKTAALNVFSLQTLVDEAAKGHPVVNLNSLKFFYDLNVHDQTTADQLAVLAPGSGSADRFANFLAKLAATPITKAIWADFLDKTADPIAQINLAVAGSTPINLMLTTPRPGADNLDSRQEIISLMVEKGNQATVRTANDDAKLKIMLDAVLAKQPALLNTAFGYVDLVSREADLIAWSYANRADLQVKAIAGVMFKMQKLVDEAAKGPGITDLKKLKFLYFLNVNNQSRANKLAVLPPTGSLNADRFANFLAKLANVDTTEDIWGDFLTKTADPRAQINLAGAGSSPIDLMLSDLWRPVVGDVLASRQKIIALMLKHGDQATVRTANDNDKLKTMLDAVLAKQPALLNTAFGHVDLTTREADLINWVSTKLADPQVKTAALNVFSLQTLVDEAAKGPGVADLKKLKFFYDLNVHDQTTADQLAGLAPNIGGLDRFANFLAKLAATADTKAIWADFLSKISAAVPQINRSGAGGAGDRPFAAMVSGVTPAGDNPANRQEIISLMVEKGDQVTVRAANLPAKLTIMLDAIKLKGDDDTMIKALGLVDLTTLKTDLLSWIKANADKKTSENNSSIGLMLAVNVEQVSVSLAELLAAAKATNASKLNEVHYLFGLYWRYIEGAGVAGIAAEATKNAAALALANSDIDGGPFIHVVARLPAIEETKNIIDDLLDRVKFVAGVPGVTGIKSKTDKNGRTALQILTGLRPAGDDANVLNAMKILVTP